MSSPDEELRELERKALEGGPEDMAAFVRSAVRLVDLAATESAKALERKRLEAEAMFADLAERFAALERQFGEWRNGLAEGCAPESQSPRIVDQWSFMPPETVKEILETYHLHDGRRRFKFESPSDREDDTTHAGTDADGWPITAGMLVEAPKSRYCPDDELRWRANVVSQFQDVSESIARIAKILHDSGLIEANWTSSIHL